MTQTIEYVVKVDANQAKTTIADVEKRMEAAAKPASVFGLSIANIGQQTKDMAGKLGPAAAAISSVSASLGAAGGEAGKLVAAGGQIVAAFGAGGPVGAAIVATTTVVDVFSKHLLDVEKAREAAFEKNFDKQNANLLAIYKRTQNLNDELRSLEKQLKNVGKTSDEVAEIELKNDAQAKRIEARRLQNVAISPMEVSGQERIKARKTAEALENEAEKLEKALIERVKLRQLIEVDANEKSAAADAKARAEREAAELKSFRDRIAAAIRFQEEYSIHVGDPATAELQGAFSQAGLRNRMRAAQAEAAAMQRQAAVDALGDEDILTGGGISPMRFDVIEATKDQQKILGDLYVSQQDALGAAYQSGAERQIEVEGNKLDIIAQLNDEYRQQEIAAQSQFVMQWTGIGVDALQTYLDAKIKGEENAEALMAASLMRTAGQALIGHGINLAGAAVVSASTGLLPVAAAQAGAAAGLIAGGVALGATATGIEHVSAGGTLGKPIDDKATKDPGASPRSSGGGGGGGPLIVNVAYGAGGPLPEDIAREIHRVTSSGNRRRGAA
jgi:hypothetical protein